MMLLHRVASVLRWLVHRSKAEQDLNDELEVFVDMASADPVRKGASPTEARRAALLHLGGLEQAKERVRTGRHGAWLDDVGRDAIYAGRVLRKSPAFTSVAVLTLALGIGATTAMFSLLDAVIFKSLPVKEPEELVLVGGAQYPVFQAFRQHTDIFVDLLATSGVTPLDVEIQIGSRERTNVSLVSGSYFSTLGLQPGIGRLFTVDDDRVPGDHPIAVVSDGYWQRRFGGDAAILDRVVRISGTPITIIGVAPPGQPCPKMCGAIRRGRLSDY
jgi:hypothetical protein